MSRGSGSKTAPPSSPDGFRGLAENGLSAERLRPVDPTLTAVQHISLVTGRDASGTGVVSNSFRVPETPITEWVSGFSASSQAKPLWVAAREHGLRVATLMWPGADGQAPDRMGDFGATWPGPAVSPSEIFDFSPETAETTGEVPSNDGLAPLMWRLTIDLGTLFARRGRDAGGAGRCQPQRDAALRHRSCAAC